MKIVPNACGSEAVYIPAPDPCEGECNLQVKTATSNGTLLPDEGYDGMKRVNVNVPNSYSASDEGKVVVNGTLISQTSMSIAENGTYDTTTKNSVTVNVEGSGGILSGIHPPSSALGEDGDYYLQTLEAPILVGDGSSWINTGVYPSQKHAFELKLCYYTDPDTSDGAIGSRDAAGSPRYNYYIQVARSTSVNVNQVRFSIQSQFGTNTEESVAEKKIAMRADLYKDLHVIKYDGNGNIVIDGTETINFLDSVTSLASNQAMMLFAININGSASLISKIAIEYCKIWDASGTLIRHFIPFDNNGTATMKDIVNDAVYSKGGNGQFSIRSLVMNVWYKENGAWSVAR